MNKRNSIEFYFKPSTKPVEDFNNKNLDLKSNKRSISNSGIIDLELEGSKKLNKKKLKKNTKNIKEVKEDFSDDDCIFLEEINLSDQFKKSEDIISDKICSVEQNESFILEKNDINLEKKDFLSINKDVSKSLIRLENSILKENENCFENLNDIETEKLKKINLENINIVKNTNTVEIISTVVSNKIELNNSICSKIDESLNNTFESSNLNFSNVFSNSKLSKDNLDDVSLISNIDFEEDILEESEKTETKKLNVSEIYRDHFIEIIESVANDDLEKDAFNLKDKEIINNFFSLSKLSQTLFIRLFLRKNQWLKKTSITYNDITENLEVYIEELIDNNFLLDSNHVFNLEEGLNILDLNELKDYGKKLKIGNLPSSKQKIINSILNYLRKSKKLSFIKTNVSLEDSALIYIKNFLMKKCFKINYEVFKLFFGIILMYFPPIIIDRGLNNFLSNIFFELYNDHDKQSESTYPEYTLNKKTKIFSKPSDLNFLIEAAILESNICECNQAKNKSEKLLKILNEAKLLFEDYYSNNSEVDKTIPIFLRKLTAGQKLIRCMNLCLDSIEHAKYYKDTNKYLEFVLEQQIYSLSSRGFLYSRLIKNYEIYCKDDSKAFELCQKSISDPYVRGALKLEILKRGVKLSKKLKIEDSNFLIEDFIKPEVTIFASTLKATIDNRKNIFCEKNSEGGHDIYKVEQIALSHYIRSGDYKNGLHSENTLFNTLFYLLFYEIIFIKKESINDIYRYKFQKLPLDFNSDDFFNSRKEEFEKKFLELSKQDNSMICKSIEESFQKLKNIKSTYNINSIELEHLKEIVSCLNINSLIEICKRLAKYNRISRSGFPDLIVWNIDEKKIKAVEVKGPNDELSDKQILWIDYMNKCGLETEVCRVKTK